ncbi:GNAT family N-acetyltransferase [uncultured Reyranella sp.]|uniref:GNAT family N-acetyltransferase n=1 Tax=uncultured Reyranella sp. TaxID=735512 RepID=UPI0025EEDE39|nr:GNAT family N-acetyltransferase [uncultured Reyranella sp.]
MSRRSGLGEVLMEIGRYIGGSPWSRIRQREALRNLDDRLLSDIGLSREQILSEGTMMRTAVEIRDAREGDMRFVQEIYAHHVLHGLASFEEEAPGVVEMIDRRENVLKLGLPYLVAEMDGRIVGYSYASLYRPRPAYRHTIEDSVYVRDGFAGNGIGRELLSTLIRRCEGGSWRQMLAVIGDSANAGSIGLHGSQGFRQIGKLDAVGFKFGRWVDSILMQRPLGKGAMALP